MLTLALQKNVINIQKCLVGDGEFLKKNHGLHCVIDTGTEHGIIVKIGLANPKQIINACFVDESVWFSSTTDKTRKSILNSKINIQDLRLLPDVRNAQRIKVVLVYTNVIHLGRSQLPLQIKFVKEILKLYVFACNSTVFLDNLTEKQRSYIYCILIEEVDSENFPQMTPNVYNVSKDTEIVVTGCISRNKYEQCYCNKNEVKLGGLDMYYNILKETLQSSCDSYGLEKKVPFSNKILLVGPSGCGKTSLVRTVVRACNFVLIEVLLPELFSSTPGDTEKKLQSYFDRAKYHSRNKEYCVILIEDLETLCTRRREDANSNLKRAVYKLITLLEDTDASSGVVIIGTTKDIQDVDAQLRRPNRFDDELDIPPPNEESRFEIISNILQYFNVGCENSVIAAFARYTPGFVGADLQLAIQETLLCYHKLEGSLFLGVKSDLFEECFKKRIANITPTSLRGAQELCLSKDTDFTHIGGLNQVKKILDFSVKRQLLYPDTFKRMGIPLTKGILLYGPPGCAKTTLVKALANECNMTFLAVSSADLYSPFVGDPERKILKLFAQARLGAPAIVFIDEIDALVGSKSGDRIRGVQERVLSTLLIEMDGVGQHAVSLQNSSLKLLANDSKESPQSERNGIIVIGATNRPEKIDAALMRPGRFDKVIYVPPPNAEERLNILQTLTRTMALGVSVDLKYISEQTVNYSGADLKNLCYESALLALTKTLMTATSIEHVHFLEVLNRTKPSLTPDMIQFYESYQKNVN